MFWTLPEHKDGKKAAETKFVIILSITPCRKRKCKMITRVYSRDNLTFGDNLTAKCIRYRMRKCGRVTYFPPPPNLSLITSAIDLRLEVR